MNALTETKTLTRVLKLDKHWKFIRVLEFAEVTPALQYHVYHYKSTGYAMYRNPVSVPRIYEEYPTVYFLPDERDRMLVVTVTDDLYGGYSRILIFQDVASRDTFADDVADRISH